MWRALYGSLSGKGAIYEWQGNRKVGQGRMEILTSTAPTSVVIQLDFIKLFKANNVTVFTLVTGTAGTTVT